MPGQKLAARCGVNIQEYMNIFVDVWGLLLQLSSMNGTQVAAIVVVVHLHAHGIWS